MAAAKVRKVTGLDLPASVILKMDDDEVEEAGGKVTYAAAKAAKPKAKAKPKGKAAWKSAEVSQRQLGYIVALACEFDYSGVFEYLELEMPETKGEADATIKALKGEGDDEE